MTAIHSSVRPGASKLPWGTILKPEFGLGHQKMTEYEIDQTVNRLYKIPEPKERVYPRSGPKMEQQEIDEMVNSLLQLSFLTTCVCSYLIGSCQSSIFRSNAKLICDLLNNNQIMSDLHKNSLFFLTFR